VEDKWLSGIHVRANFDGRTHWSSRSASSHRFQPTRKSPEKERQDNHGNDHAQDDKAEANNSLHPVACAHF
jgi:hypothetical protein